MVNFDRGIKLGLNHTVQYLKNSGQETSEWLRKIIKGFSKFWGLPCEKFEK